MTAQEKRFKNLSTYAVIMILAVVILIIIAAMADNRERQFKDEQEQTVMSIQNEIVRLTDENHKMSKELEALKTEAEVLKEDNNFYTVMIAAWDCYSADDFEGALSKLEEISPDTLDETQKASYDALINLLKEE